MIHPHTQVVAVSDVVGLGVIATSPIPRGTIVWTQDALDRVWDPGEVGRLSAPTLQLLERYAHLDERGRFVLCWDAGKLINHSCEPTVRGIGAWFQVARRDIAPGEAITCDYAECNITDDLACLCGSPGCRGSVSGRDLLRFAEEWDTEARLLLGDVARVEQPLWPYLLLPEEAQAMLEGHLPLPSFRALYASPQP